MDFLKQGNLPKATVTCAVMAGKYPHLNEKLALLGVKTIPLVTNEAIDNTINYHSDILFHHLGDNYAITDSVTNKQLLRLFGVDCAVDNEVRGKYPKSVRLNAVQIGKRVFCNTNYLSKLAFYYYKENGFELVHVNQGYTKCSVCVLNEHTIITDDSGIHQKVLNYNIESLLIEKGDIILEGQPYGFIGGCTGLIDINKLAFTGSLNNHKDEKKILAFLQKHEIIPIYLYDGPLLDVGGIIPILTKPLS